MKKAVIAIAAFAISVSAFAGYDQIARSQIESIRRGDDNQNSIVDLNVSDDAAIGGDIAITGDATVSGALTVSGVIGSAYLTDTNVTVDATDNTPLVVGQLLYGTVSNELWMAVAVDTNSWVKIGSGLITP